MNAITRVDEAVSTLVDIAKAALPTGFQVLDGPLLGELMSEAFVVGLADSPDVPGYEAEVTRQDGFGRPRYIEVVTVRCMLTVSSAGRTITELRGVCSGHLAALDAALRDRHVEGGVWDKAELGSRFQWTPYRGPAGSTVNVFLSVVGANLL